MRSISVRTKLFLVLCSFFAAAVALNAVSVMPASGALGEGISSFSGSTTSSVVTATNTGAATTSNAAIFASSAGSAIVGKSSAKFSGGVICCAGVVGRTSATPIPLSTAHAAGVFGQDLAAASPSFNAGVAGLSAHGAGVFGQSTTGSGIEGQSSSGNGVHAVSSSGFALEAENFSTTHHTLILGNHGGGPIIEAENPAFSSAVMTLDSSGNMHLSGTLYTKGHPGGLIVTSPTVAGREVGTYAAQQTLPTVEDLGEAQLINGQAFVRLEPTFASAIDSREGYLVFLTPQGQSHGSLYVTQKSIYGFAVRENQGGRSTLVFDYRIVAKPFASNARRLPVQPAR